MQLFLRSCYDDRVAVMFDMSASSNEALDRGTYVKFMCTLMIHLMGCCL